MACPLVKSFFLLLTLLVLFVIPHQTVAEQLSGPSFSDPDFIQKMPSNWQNKSVEHDSSSGGVDLVISLNQQFSKYVCGI